VGVGWSLAAWQSGGLTPEFLTTREAAWYIILVLSVCLCVCLYVCMYVCQTITFESLDVGSSYLHMRYISTDYGLSSYMKAIGSRSR